jgi:endoglucanase
MQSKIVSVLAGFKLAAMTPLAKTMAIVLAAAGASAFGTRAEAGEFKVRRAINMAQWFTWPRYQAVGAGIEWPPYKEARNDEDVATLHALREAGFDTIRLPVDPAPFIVFDGERRATVYAMLFETVGRINAAGLNVIVDIHPNSRHPVWGQNAVAAGLEAPAFAAVENVIGEMASRLKGSTDKVALELLNEPRLKCKGSEQALWQQMAQHFAERARSANPKLTLIVTGACISTPEGLMALDPTPFAKGPTVYTFHFYEPFSFTHQGAQFIPWPDKYLDGLPWPASARPMGEPAALLDAQVSKQPGMTDLERMTARTKAMYNLERYYAQNADVALIDKRFREVADWARKNSIAPTNIFIGEFGVLRHEPSKPGAFCADRARWHRDVRRTAEACGFAWSYFNYDGPFGLVKEDGNRELDPVTLASLGLKLACGVAELSDSSAKSDAQPPSGKGAACIARCPLGENGDGDAHR